jgi:hypothetical protein
MAERAIVLLYRIKVISPPDIPDPSILAIRNQSLEKSPLKQVHAGDE